MTPGDAARILAVAAAFDRRTVGETDAIVWADALDDLDARECAEAVRAHYRDTDAWVMPSHVRALVVAHRRDQARRRADERVLRGIASATERYDRERSHAAYLEARRAFTEALLKNAPTDDADAAS